MRWAPSRCRLPPGCPPVVPLVPRVAAAPWGRRRCPGRAPAASRLPAGGIGGSEPGDLFCFSPVVIYDEKAKISVRVCACWMAFNRQEVITFFFFFFSLPINTTQIWISDLLLTSL